MIFQIYRKQGDNPQEKLVKQFLLPEDVTIYIDENWYNHNEQPIRIQIDTPTVPCNQALTPKQWKDERHRDFAIRQARINERKKLKLKMRGIREAGKRDDTSKVSHL